MKSELDELMLLFTRIDNFYEKHDRLRHKTDLTYVFMIINASVILDKVDIDEARVLLDLNNIKFIKDRAYVDDIVQCAISYVNSNKYLPPNYKKKEYLAPLMKLKDFFLLAST